MVFQLSNIQLYFISFPKDEIMSALEKVCTLLPFPLSTECKKIVEKDGDLIVEAVLEDVKSGNICELFKFCNPGKSIYLRQSFIRIELYSDQRIDISGLPLFRGSAEIPRI